MEIPFNKDLFVGDSPSFETSQKAELKTIVEEVEKIFGERDESYEIAAILFYDGPPHIKIQEKKLIIYLGQTALNNLYTFIFQLSHEAVHLLSPVFDKDVIWLEESIATSFSVKYTDNKQYGRPSDKEYKYIKAKNLGDKILKINPAIIKKLRSRNFVISDIKIEDLISAGIKPYLANPLSEKFKKSPDRDASVGKPKTARNSP